MSIVRDGQRSNRVSIQPRDNRFFSPPKRLCWIRGPPGPLLSGCQGLFLRRQSDRMWTDYSRPSSVEVKNEWNYTSTLPYDWMLIRGTTLPLQNIPMLRPFLSSDEKVKIGPAEPKIVIGRSMWIWCCSVKIGSRFVGGRWTENDRYPLSYGVPVRERYGSTLLPATRQQHDQNCTQSH